MMLCRKGALLGSVYVSFETLAFWRNFVNSFGICDRHTLWKRVQTLVVPLLAQLVSVMDRDQNLDILLDENCNESVKRLWLDIFSNEKLLEIPQLMPDYRSVLRTSQH